MIVWKREYFQEPTVKRTYYDGDVTSEFTPSSKQYWKKVSMERNVKTVSLMQNGEKHLFLTMEDLLEWRTRRNPTVPYKCENDNMCISIQKGASLRHKHPPVELRKWIR